MATPLSSAASSGSSLSTTEDGRVSVEHRCPRCHMLEMSMLKFKQKAATVKELLSDKMRDMEARMQAAEARAEEAGEKTKASESDGEQNSPSPASSLQRIQHLEAEARKRDKVITLLRTQLDEQKKLRSEEGRLIQEKSSRIKDWVTAKLKTMEDENLKVKEENDTLRTQVETLRQRLQALPSSLARHSHRLTLQNGEGSASSISSEPTTGVRVPPPVPRRPSSSIMESLRHELGAPLSGSHQDEEDEEDEVEEDCEGPPTMEDMEPDYQEIDDNHESKYEPKRSGPPQIRIERKVFPQATASIASSGLGSEDAYLDRHSPSRAPLERADSGAHEQRSHDGGRGHDHIPRAHDSLPKAHDNIPRAHDRIPRAHDHIPRAHDNIPRAYDAIPRAHDQLKSSDKARALSKPAGASASPASHSRPEHGGKHNHSLIPQPKAGTSSPCSLPGPLLPASSTVSALATMPRHKKGIPVPVTSREFESQTLDRRLLYKQGQHFDRSQSERRPKPPTPPLRRLPSWENRIYAVANVGLRLPDNGNLESRESSVPVTDGLYTEHMYQELSVPVYTSIRGKAAQIRSTPFSGCDSSSDSSDEDSGGALGVSASPAELARSVAGPSGPRTTTTVRTVNPSSSGATKRGVSTHSVQSVTSDSSDYALPPDDDVSIQTDSSSGDSEPEQKLLKYTVDTLKKDSLEKCGYLTKLGGKVKNWRKRWFELKHGQLLYYKSPSDIARKPRGHINLDGRTRVSRTEGELTFQIATAKRTYYVAAESGEEMEHWIRVVQNVLKKQAADKALSNGRAKETMKGWLIKTKNGRNRRVWCVLLGKLFLYYKSPQDKSPIGQLHLRDARVEEVDRSCDSESDSDDTSVPDYTLAIWPANHGPTYLMIPTKHEKDSWLYHLSVCSGGGSGKLGTEYEQVIAKLMEVDGDPASVFWKLPVLLHSKEPIPSPLTTLPSELLQSQALDLFKQVQHFMHMPVESSHLDAHVSRAQSILASCLHQPQLQNELYCQLIRQTSRHPPQHKSGVQTLLLCGGGGSGGSSPWFLCDAAGPASPTSSLLDLPGASDSKHNPQQAHVMSQGWQLLAMAVPLFAPPGHTVLWHLRAHLQRHADPQTEIGKYAVFCQRALERTAANGGRDSPPSRMEVMSILLRHPYHHSQPLSIPVHFLNGTYQVVSFDGSTTVAEFLKSLTKSLNLRDTASSGFSLFTDDPAGQELEHCLKGHIKLCDVISKWEQAYLHHHQNQQQQPLPDAKNTTVKLTFKNRLYFKSGWRFETEKERFLLAYQVNDDVVNGRFPLNRDLAVEMAALMAQIEYGDLRSGETYQGSPSHQRSSSAGGTPPIHVVVERFYPRRYRDMSPVEMSHLERRLCDKWAGHRGRSLQDCVRIYLTVARKWPFFGCRLFSVSVKAARGEPGVRTWLAVQEDSIAVLDFTSLKAVSTFGLQSVVTFGGCRDDFMLVVTEKTPEGTTRTDRLIFGMTKPKMLELTMLLASYINSRGRHASRSQQSTAAAAATGNSRSSLSSASIHV